MPQEGFKVRADLVLKERVDEQGNEDFIIKDPVSGKYFSVSPLTYEVARAFKSVSSFAAGHAAINELSSEPVPETDVRDALAEMAQLELLEPSEEVIDSWRIETRYIRRALRLNHLDWRKIPTKNRWLRDTVRFMHEGRLPAPLAYRMARKLRSKFKKDERYQRLVDTLLLARSFQQRKEESARLPFLVRYMRVQLPLVNPDRQLEWLEPRLRWLFSTPFFVLTLLLNVVGIFAYRATAPNIGDLLPALTQNMPLLFACTFVMLAIHEYCHALTCKHFGGEVREIGVMMLFLVLPAAYADVSDAHLFSSRKDRVWVTFAGTYSSLVLASLGAVLCAVTETSSFIYQVNFLFMVIGYATVLSNLNPLIPLDGYFMLVDLVGIDNLRETAKEWRHALRMKWFLLSYWLVGSTYQTFYLLLTLTMMWGVLVRSLGLVGLAAYGVMLNKMLLHNWKRRVAAVAVVVVLALAAVPHVPVHSTVGGEIVPPPADEIVAPDAGPLTKHKQNGDTVQPGDLLFSIDNPELAAALSTEQSAVAELRAQLEDLKQGISHEMLAYLNVREQAARLAVQREARALESITGQNKAGVMTDLVLERQQQRAAAAQHAAAIAEARTRSILDTKQTENLIRQTERMLSESEERLAKFTAQHQALSVTAKRAGRLLYHSRPDGPLVRGEAVAWVGDGAAIEVPMPEWLPADGALRAKYRDFEGPLAVAPTLSPVGGGAVRKAWLTIPGTHVFGQHVKVKVSAASEWSPLESWTGEQFSTMVFDLWRLL